MWTLCIFKLRQGASIVHFVCWLVCWLVGWSVENFDPQFVSTLSGFHASIQGLDPKPRWKVLFIRWSINLFKLRQGASIVHSVCWSVSRKLLSTIWLTLKLKYEIERFSFLRNESITSGKSTLIIGIAYIWTKTWKCFKFDLVSRCGKMTHPTKIGLD